MNIYGIGLILVLICVGALARIPEMWPMTVVYAIVCCPLTLLAVDPEIVRRLHERN